MRKSIFYFVMAMTMLLSLPSVAKTPLTLVKGDPMIILQEQKKAVYEIDYSQMLVTDGKEYNDMDFYMWMKTRDEDGDEWTKDWEEKDKASCDKAFRENFNDEVKHGFRLSKFGKDYKVVFRLKKIDFGPPVKYSWKGFTGGEADAWGEFEVRDFNTDEVLLLMTFDKLRGEDSFKQIGRLKGVFENFGEQLAEYLKDYQKALKKKKK